MPLQYEKVLLQNSKKIGFPDKFYMSVIKYVNT